MRIAHIVSYVSEDGAFGGPLAVATSQTRELARRGHEVDLLAGWDGKVSLDIPGVTTRLFKVRRVAPGFSGLLSPGLQRFIRSHAHRYDAVHVHLGRDMISMPAALSTLRGRARLVSQTHGMVMPDPRAQVAVFDAIATRKVLNRSRSVLSLTATESQGIASVAGPKPVNVTRIANGIQARAEIHLAKPLAAVPEILFLARLHPRKRVLVFADMAQLLSDRGVRAKFTVVGPDEGELDALLQRIRAYGPSVNLAYEGTLPPGTAPFRLAQADMYVLPSHSEVFPMTVLESMAAGTPAVISNDCAIAPELAERGAAIVTDGTAAGFADAVEHLVNDLTLRSSVVAAASAVVSDTWSIAAVVTELESIYRS